MRVKRVFLIVLDSFGVGALPDADVFGDEGSDTLASVVRVGVSLPQMTSLGLFNIAGTPSGRSCTMPQGAFGRLIERSQGKDTTVGHWEIAGVISTHAMPVYPKGFPADFLNNLSRRVGRGILCNLPYSGTDVIHDFGRQHLETGDLIVYTSADSVCQIAAHEEKVPLEELYHICQVARELLTGENAVGRVIARPFTGVWPNFARTANRHDFSLQPPGQTLLDRLTEAGREVIAVGKISDIFAGRGITRTIATHGNADGMEKMSALLSEDFTGLAFVNLVDFDMLYGHRNDSVGYAAALEKFDCWLGETLPRLMPEDVLMITADHGCDPGTPSTDHSREYTPLLVAGPNIACGVHLGTRASFTDIAATVQEMLGVSGNTDGKSFAALLATGRGTL
ncbi:MAG: phosphopentomutase [Oscillospiraceae bacterium]